ncbi:hypothetical protein ACJZ2D_000475 [Fusarium nematophilum]
MSNITASDPRLKAALQAILGRGETGVSVVAYYRGKLIAQGIAGYADVAGKRSVDSRTIFPVFSVTRGITAMAVHIQADRGFISLQDPIAKYWPEFAANGKESITVENALSHRAGIPQMPDGVTPELMADWDWMVQQVASFIPKFPPGTVNAYHVLVWGWILGKVVVRTDPKHRPLGQFVEEEIFKPLGVEDLYLGVPDAQLSRVATLYGGNEPFLEDTYNTSPMPVFPGANVHNLKVLPVPVWFGAAGFWLGGEKGASDPIVGDHCEVIYSPGAGGSLAWADIRDRIAVSICHSNIDTGVSVDPEPIWTLIGRAIREIIAEMQD